MSFFADLSSSVRLSRFRVRLCSEDSFPPDLYLGSTLRGALGWQMQRLVCPFEGRKKCENCLVQGDCPYHELYQKKTPMPGILDSPRGYVYYLPPGSKTGLIELEITLFGSCSRFAPVLFEALLRAAKSGLTRRRVPVEVERIHQVLPDGKKEIYGWKQLSPQVEDALSLTSWFDCSPWTSEPELAIKTPLRLRKNGRYLDYLDLDFFLQNTLRRMEALGSVFGQGKPVGKDNWARLKKEVLPEEVRQCSSSEELGGSGLSYHARTEWDDYKRYSNTQRKKVPMGGITGEVQVKGADRHVFSLLKAAELMHVGKGAAMGLGRVEVEN